MTDAAPTPLRAPFPWFGGKSRAAGLIWQAFGDVPNYVEPFAGSLATLLARPHAPRTETVNDADCYLANFWRAVAHDPEAVARHADWPVNEADLSARHAWLVAQTDFRARMVADPDYYDAKIAGWWVWGLCSWIGSGWCSGEGPWVVEDGTFVHRGNAGMGIHRQLPHLGDAGRGIHRQLPHLGNAGMGVHRKLPHLGDAGRGDLLSDVFAPLADRLRRVRVACGDWSRIVTESVTVKHGTTAVLFDPPYDDGAMDYSAGGRGISGEVREWAVANGDSPDLRIVLCGYEGEHAMPETWRVVPWKARKGYGGQRADGTSNDNRERERLWLSPACLPVDGEMSVDGSVVVPRAPYYGELFARTA